MLLSCIDVGLFWAADIAQGGAASSVTCSLQQRSAPQRLADAMHAEAARASNCPSGSWQVSRHSTTGRIPLAEQQARLYDRPSRTRFQLLMVRDLANLPDSGHLPYIALQSHHTLNELT